MLACVVNISEGRDGDILEAVAAAAGYSLLDLHRDPHHNRSVLTLAGPAVVTAARSVVTEAVHRIDLATHVGVHPRLGAVDVVPFVPLGQSSMADAVEARDRFAHWASEQLGLACFLYGPSSAFSPARSLPELRRLAFNPLIPDVGPSTANSSSGALCVGARPPLVAYNVWLDASASLGLARDVARTIRSPMVRTLGLNVGGRSQVSMNLIEPTIIGPAYVYDAVALVAPVSGAELVGLIPAAALAAIPESRWTELDVGPNRTIESRIDAASGHW